MASSLVNNKYRITRRIGGGSFGEIYMGIGPNNEKVCIYGKELTDSHDLMCLLTPIYPSNNHFSYPTHHYHHHSPPFPRAAHTHTQSMFNFTENLATTFLFSPLCAAHTGRCQVRKAWLALPTAET